MRISPPRESSFLRASALTLVAFLIAILGCTPASNTDEPAADIVIVGGRVWTGVPEAPWAEAVATRGDRILAIGSRSEVEALADRDTRTLDANGGLVTPGFIDTHVHFMDGGFALSSVQLRDAKTPEEFARRVGEFAETVPAGTWILNGDWDHEQWGGELPHRDWIDAVTPDHPVFINRLDGHMALANSAALRAAGLLDASTKVDVEGGETVRGKAGGLTGVLKDNSMGLVQRVIPTPPPELQDAALLAASRHVLQHGVTTVHHMGSWADLEVYERAADQGRLEVGIYSCVPLATWQQLAERMAAPPASDLVRIGCLKGMVDGSLGSHTAAFLEPYTDLPEEGGGLYVRSIEDIERDAADADNAGLQVNVHAIGDRAIRELLDAFARVAEANGSKDRRFRIEHSQHIHPDDLGRFAEQNIIASMQPYHAIDDGRWATRVIGEERSQTTYAFGSLLESGARVAFGSDWTVAPATPLEGIYAAVTRRTLDGANPDGWVPGEKITVEQALIAYTVEGAFAGREEDEKGTIEEGKRADLVIIDSDILALPEDRWAEIAEAEVTATVLGGKVVVGATRGKQ